jgi:TonB family protein
MHSLFTNSDIQLRSRRGIFISTAVHCGLLWLLLWCFRPNFVKVSLAKSGDRGTNTKLTYLLPAGLDQQPDTQHATLIHLRRTKHLRKLAPSSPKAATELAQTPAEPAPAGSPSGSLLQGSFNGSEARPALPVVFPDPMISRSDLPAGVEGTEVVEVTIDRQGNVTETRVLQSLGSSVDEKVLAAVRSWRFTPATVDGMAIASRQDVHFHLPNS